MSPETKPKQPTNAEKDYDPNDVRTLSAPIVNRVHDRLDTASRQVKLDKASIVRLAVRDFIRRYYKGNGQWQLPKELDLDMIVARDAVRADYDLPD